MTQKTYSVSPKPSVRLKPGTNLPGLRPSASGDTSSTITAAPSAGGCVLPHFALCILHFALARPSASGDTFAATAGPTLPSFPVTPGSYRLNLLPPLALDFCHSLAFGFWLLVISLAPSIKSIIALCFHVTQPSLYPLITHHSLLITFPLLTLCNNKL